MAYEVETCRGPLYISHGTEDTVWPYEMTRNLEKRLLSQRKVHHMFKKIITFSAIGYFCIFFQSCAGGTMYGIMKEMQRMDCSRIESPSERRKCLEEVDELSYDRYEKERKGSGTQ